MVEVYGAVLTCVGVFALAGALFGLLHVRRPNGESRLLAPLCVAAAVASLALALRHAAAASGAAAPDAAAWWLPAFALTARLAFREARLRRAPAAILAIYGVAAGLALLDLVPRTAAIGLALSYAAECAAAIGLTASVARAYVGGRRELGPIIFASGLLTLTALHDALSGLRWVGAGPSVLAPFGFTVLVTGYVAKHVLAYSEVRQKLEQGKRELRSRARELRNSHHELMAAQAELSTKEQLAAVGELAAVVAHEVRNPLAIIGNAVSSLRKETVAAPDRATLLEILDSEASRLNRIVTDLLRFSRPLTLQQAPVPVAELIERALHLIRPRTNVSVDLQLVEADARAWADSNLLRQVLDNLIENAVQAMESGGTLTVRLRVSEAARETVDRVEDGVIVEIIDTGEGMDTAVRRRAKDPFFTTRSAGTGLGLAIVDRIVVAHGGRIEIESRSGQGTTVRLYLPSSSCAPPSRPSAGALLASAKGAPG